MQPAASGFVTAPDDRIEALQGVRAEIFSHAKAKLLRDAGVQMRVPDALAGVCDRQRGGMEEIRAGFGAPVFPVAGEGVPVYRRLGSDLMGPPRRDPHEPKRVRGIDRDRFHPTQGTHAGIRRSSPGSSRHPVRSIPAQKVVPCVGRKHAFEQRDVPLEHRSVAKCRGGRLRSTQREGEDQQAARVSVEAVGRAGAKAHPVRRTSGKVPVYGCVKRPGPVGELATALVHNQQVIVLMNDASGKGRSVTLDRGARVALPNGGWSAVKRLGQFDRVTLIDASVSLNATTIDGDLSGPHRPVDAAQRHVLEQTSNDPVYTPAVIVRAENCPFVPGSHSSTVPSAPPVDKGRAGRQTQTTMEARTVAALYEMVSGPVFLSAFFSWFIAQFLKTIIDVVRHRSRTSGEAVSTMFWKTGGMPSSHSSLVTALATSIGFEYGAGTPIFTLSLFYGVLIIRDALGVRRSSGLQARALNEIGAQLVRRFGIRYHPVKEVSGHTPTEVTVGVALGFFIAVAFSLL